MAAKGDISFSLFRLQLCAMVYATETKETKEECIADIAFAGIMEL